MVLRTRSAFPGRLIEHRFLGETRSPISVTVRCSCGWSHTERRTQNALARTSKMRAAIQRHYREMEKKRVEE